MNHQDWTPVIFKKKAPKTVKDAKKRGYVTKRVKKQVGNPNTKRNVNSRKIEEETETFKIAKISTTVRKAIQQGRSDKSLTQKELAQKINAKPTVINDYESGRAIPNNYILGKMEKVLGIKLRGKNIGEPIVRKFKKKEKQ
jgi:putative transcription factor